MHSLALPGSPHSHASLRAGGLTLCTCRRQSEAMVKAALEILQVGAHADRGSASSSMEDRHCLFRSSGFAFFGLFDGNSGSTSASFCREQLHLQVLGSPHFGRKGDVGVRQALLEGFMRTEQVGLTHLSRIPRWRPACATYTRHTFSPATRIRARTKRGRERERY